jgi:hypothetical protein
LNEVLCLVQLVFVIFRLRVHIPLMIAEMNELMII